MFLVIFSIFRFLFFVILFSFLYDSKKENIIFLFTAFTSLYLFYINLFITMLYGLYIYTIMFLAILSEHRFVESFGKRRCRNRQKMSKDNDNEPMKFYNPLKDSEEDFVDPHCSCDNAGFGIVQKIPYLPIQSSNRATVYVQFSSACIRCGLCLAVAEQVSES